MHYYQFNIASFCLHTAHLTLEEEAVYRRLLDFYYDTEKPIPTETQSVIRRLRLVNYTAQVEQVLSEFFTLEGDGWHNFRCDIEIKAYQAKADSARKNGKKGGRPPKNKGPETQLVNLANPGETQTKPDHKLTKNYKLGTINKELLTKCAASPPPPWIDQYVDLFWSIYPKKVDKKKSIARLRKMIKANPNKGHFDVILDRVRAKSTVTDKQFWPTADRYLRDEKWEDEIINQSPVSKKQSQEDQLNDHIAMRQHQLERLAEAPVQSPFGPLGVTYDP